MYYLGIKNFNIQQNNDNLNHSRLGGIPTFSDKQILNHKWFSKQSLICTNCGNSLYFILQAQLPITIEDNRSILERSVYIFICNTNECITLYPSKSIIAFFIQKNRKEYNLFIENTNMSIYSLDNILGTMKLANQEIFNLDLYTFSFPIVPIEWQSRQKPKKMANTLLNVKYSDCYKNSDEHYEKEAYENTYTSTYTKEFAKFEIEIEQDPWQIIRYSECGLNPLYYSAISNINEFKYIEGSCKCGSERVLECQLMPAILSLLPTEDDCYLKHIKNSTVKNPLDIQGMDWGTIFIFTCKTLSSTECECCSMIDGNREKIYIQKGAVFCQYDNINH